MKGKNKPLARILAFITKIASQAIDVVHSIRGQTSYINILLLTKPSFHILTHYSFETRDVRVPCKGLH